MPVQEGLDPSPGSPLNQVPFRPIQILPAPWSIATIKTPDRAVVVLVYVPLLYNLPFVEAFSHPQLSEEAPTHDESTASVSSEIPALHRPYELLLK